MDFESGYLEVNNARLYYEIAGQGRPVVFVHGFSVDTRMWDQQFAHFSEKYRVLRYDMRGFGRSSLPDEHPYDPCADLAQLMSTLNIDQAVIVGLSLGGWVAIDFALAYPQRVSGMVAVDAAVMGFDWPNGRPSGLPAEVANTSGIEAAKQYWLASDLFAPAREQARVLRALDEMVSDYSGWHWVNENLQIMADEPAINCLDRITCPSLVLVGERDLEDFHAIANILTDRIPLATKIELPSAGHMSNMENPKAFNSVLEDFLKQFS